MSSLHTSAVCGGGFERRAWPLFRWRWRGRRGERWWGWGGGGGGGGGGRGGVGGDRASSGGTAAGGATRWRVRWQGLEHTATPLLNRVLNKDRDKREFHCVVVVLPYLVILQLSPTIPRVLYIIIILLCLVVSYTITSILHVWGGPLYKAGMVLDVLVPWENLVISRSWLHWNLLETPTTFLILKKTSKNDYEARSEITRRYKKPLFFYDF